MLIMLKLNDKNERFRIDYKDRFSCFNETELLQSLEIRKSETSFQKEEG